MKHGQILEEVIGSSEDQVAAADDEEAQQNQGPEEDEVDQSDQERGVRAEGVIWPPGRISSKDFNGSPQVQADLVSPDETSQNARIFEAQFWGLANEEGESAEQKEQGRVAGAVVLDVDGSHDDENETEEEVDAGDASGWRIGHVESGDDFSNVLGKEHLSEMCLFPDLNSRKAKFGFVNLNVIYYLCLLLKL